MVVHISFLSLIDSMFMLIGDNLHGGKGWPFTQERSHQFGSWKPSVTTVESIGMKVAASLVKVG